MRRSGRSEFMLTGERLVRQARIKTRRRRERPARVAYSERVAVRRGLRQGGETKRAAGAGPVVDHHTLTQRARDLLENDSAYKVLYPSGCERNDHSDRARW